MRRSGRLNGQLVCLAASIPVNARDERYQRIDQAHVEIEDAIISFTRSIISAGGRILFGGQPAVSRLIAQVAGEYELPHPLEPEAGATEPSRLIALTPVLIYQSEAFRRHVRDDTWLLQQLGFAEIRWTPAVGGERFDARKTRKPQCEKSLTRMRRQMIDETRPRAMVCVGGMEGVEREFEMFTELLPGAPVFVLKTTGGAAGLIADRIGSHLSIRIVDDNLTARLSELRDRVRAPEHPREQSGLDRGHGQEDESSEKAEHEFTPYPLIMQQIVEQLVA